MARAKGEGTIWQTADGRWRASVEAGWTERGTRRRRSVSADTEAKVRRRLRDLIRSLNDDTASLNPRQTVRGWCLEWLAEYQRFARPRTYETDAGMVRKWLIPTLGNRMLSDLTAADIYKLDRAVAGQRASKTAANVHALALRIMRAAVEAGYRVPPAVFATRAPLAAPSGRAAIPIMDAVNLLHAAQHPMGWPALPDLPPLGRGRKRDPELVAAHKRRKMLTERDPSRWVAALLNGMRQGEALGLTWEHVDFDRHLIDVSWQLQHLPAGATIRADLQLRHLKGNYYLMPPKTTAGRRIIPMVPWMETALLKWRDECPKSPHDLVWPRASGDPMSKQDDLAAWHGLQEAAGVAKTPDELWTLHEARHTTVSLLEAAGVPQTVIIAIVGHATYASTKRYSHATIDQARQALESVASSLQLTQD